MPLPSGVLPLVNFLASQTGAEAAAKWAKGPLTNYRSANVPLATYVQWLRTLEASPALASASPAQIVQRLRRLHFSRFTEPFKQRTSTLADQVIDDTTGYANPGLTTDHVDQVTLDGLFSTSSVVTARNLPVDVGHIWMGVDLELAGIDLETAAGEVVFLDSELRALLTWAGDLGSAANTYANNLLALQASDRTAAKRKEEMLAQVAGLASKSDLLGDMDAVVLAKRLDSLPGFVLSDEIEAYYADDDKPQDQAKLINRPNSARRFHYFLRDAVPAIPAGGKDSSPLEVVLDTADLTPVHAMLRTTLLDAVDDIVSNGELAGATYSGEGRVESAGMDQFVRLYERFVLFLVTGLRTGDAAWPGAAW